MYQGRAPDISEKEILIGYDWHIPVKKYTSANVKGRGPAAVRALDPMWALGSAQTEWAARLAANTTRKEKSGMKDKKAFGFPLKQRQLFLDDCGIAEIRNLKRRMHQPAKKGAVIRPDLSAGETSHDTNCAPAWDESRQAYRWAVNSTKTWIWESKDGLHWTRVGESGLRSCAVAYDASEAELAHRYKTLLIYNDETPGGVAVSPDLLTWTKLDIPTPPVPVTDEFNAFLDKQNHTFIATAKIIGSHGRSVALLTSTDFITWENHGLIFHADELDQSLGVKNIEARLANPALHQPYWPADPDSYNVDVYNVGVFAYEGLYIGIPAMFHSVGPVPNYPNTFGFHLVQLACSRDLKTWQRLGDRRPFIGPSPLGAGAYDLPQILPPSAPIVHGNELWFYYTGIKYRASWKYVGEYPDGEHIPLPGFDRTRAQSAWPCCGGMVSSHLMPMSSKAQYSPNRSVCPAASCASTSMPSMAN